MTFEAYKVETYWRPRRESTRDCAVRLIRMLNGLAETHRAFSHWNKQAKTRAAANKPAWSMPPDIDELTQVFERGKQYKDVPREPWPEMGFSISAWNGRDRPHAASLGIRSGVYADWRPFPNTADLSLNAAGPDNADLIKLTVLRPALLSFATAWEPDYGVVICWEYWERLFGDRPYPPFRSGWMTYLAAPYASRVTPPPAAIVESVPGGGLLLLATTERFSMDNPAHLAIADAIQAALDPIQDMVPPGRDAHLRHGPGA